MSNTHQIHIKYAIKYMQIWVYLAHDPGGLSTCQIRIKYAIKYTQIWVYLRWAEYMSDMHQIRKQMARDDWVWECDRCGRASREWTCSTGKPYA